MLVKEPWLVVSGSAIFWEMILNFLHSPILVAWLSILRGFSSFYIGGSIFCEVTDLVSPWGKHLLDVDSYACSDFPIYTLFFRWLPILSPLIPMAPCSCLLSSSRTSCVHSFVPSFPCLVPFLPWDEYACLVTSNSFGIHEYNPWWRGGDAIDITPLPPPPTRAAR